MPVDQSSKGTRFIDLVICLLAGSLLTLAFAPFDYYLAGIISPAILFYFWFKSGAREAFKLGYAYGLGLFGTGVNWLHISINLFGGVNLAGALFLTYLLVAFLALYPAIVGYLSRRYSTDNTLGLLLILPALWTLGEWCRSWFFTGFPWLNVGYTQTDTPLSGFAPIAGIYAMSWLTCLNAALLVYLIVTPGKKRLFASAGMIFIWGMAVLMNSVEWARPDPEQKSVAIVQAAVPQELKWQPEQQQRTLELYLSLSGPYWGTDVIVWPETAIPMLYQQAGSLIDMLRSQALQYGTGFLSGIPFQDPPSRKYFNSIIVLGESTGIYHKRHLVPFGEYLPLDRWLRPVLDMLRIPMSNFSPGTDKPLLNVAGVPAGMSICYEDVFGEEIIDALPEAKFLVNVSNDAWFGDSLAPHQHLQMARLRAKETGRYLVRATNTGISAIINEQGKIVDLSPQFEPYVVAGNIKTFTGATPYSRFGNYPVIIFALIVLAGCCFYTCRKK